MPPLAAQEAADHALSSTLPEPGDMLTKTFYSRHGCQDAADPGSGAAQYGPAVLLSSDPGCDQSALWTAQVQGHGTAGFCNFRKVIGRAGEIPQALC